MNNENFSGGNYFSKIKSWILFLFTFEIISLQQILKFWILLKTTFIMHRLPILADFLFLHNLLSEKSIDHQSFEAISALVQKKFQKNDQISVATLLSVIYICR